MPRAPTLAAALVGLALIGAGAPGCGSPSPILPAAYRGSYVQVRDCRFSSDHGLVNITVLASPDAASAYVTGAYPFAPGTILVKEQWSDMACTELVGWTVMRKEPPGYDTENGDWHWQNLDTKRAVIDDGRLGRCLHCHAADACKPRDFTCTDP